MTIYFKHDNVPSALANGETVLREPYWCPTPRRVTCTFNRWRSSYTLRCWPLSSSIPDYVFRVIRMVKWFAWISQEKQDIQNPDLFLWLAYTSAKAPVRSQACLTWDLLRTWHWGAFISRYVGSPPSLSFHECSICIFCPSTVTKYKIFRYSMLLAK